MKLYRFVLLNFAGNFKKHPEVNINLVSPLSRDLKEVDNTFLRREAIEEIW